MVFGIGEAAPYHRPRGCFWGGRSSDVADHYFVFCTNISLDNEFPADDPWFGADAEYEILLIIPT